VCSDDEDIAEIVQRSRSLEREGMEHENEMLLRSAVARFPGSAELAIRAGAATFDTPRDSKAYLRRAAELAPEDPATLTRCASLFVSHREFEEAETLVMRAGERAPADFVLGYDLAHTAGQLAAVKGKNELAERMLVGAFEGRPDVPHFGRELALFLESLGRPVEALAVLSEALRLNPGDEHLREVRREMLEAWKIGEGDP